MKLTEAQRSQVRCMRDLGIVSLCPAPTHEEWDIHVYPNLDGTCSLGPAVSHRADHAHDARLDARLCRKRKEAP